MNPETISRPTDHQWSLLIIYGLVESPGGRFKMFQEGILSTILISARFNLRFRFSKVQIIYNTRFKYHAMTETSARNIWEILKSIS